MKTQKIKQVLLGLIVPAVIVAAWICATHFGKDPDQHPAENLHGVAGVSGNLCKAVNSGTTFRSRFPVC